MAAKNFKKVLKQVLENIEPSHEDKKFIENSVRDFKSKLRNKIKEKGLQASVFEGGSYAKGTLMKKDSYDIDLFVRFGKRHENENLSDLTREILEDIKEVESIHGSRDYFRIKFSSELEIELVPVLKISHPEKAVNVTDLSYSHVKYIKNNTDKKLQDEIKIAKAFCHATKTYGAESYISGFSGYALELLMIHHGSFVKFLKEMVKERKEKLIIDMEKHYKNKNEILLDINSSKLNSPIILIDPTYKKRNALAALSEETFERFKKEAKKFLENPSTEHFKKRKLNTEDLRSYAEKNGFDFVLLESKTKKQEGNIAGSKLMKFHRHLIEESSRYFQVEKQDFEYDGQHSAKSVFITSKELEITFKGPMEKDLEHAKKFKQKHSKTFSEKGRLYAKEPNYKSLKEFFEDWKSKNRHRLKEMDIETFSIKDSN